LKILFVGIGSIAKRHINNLRDIYGYEDLVIDALRHDKNTIPDGVNSVFTSPDKLTSGYDAVFITNPTEKHVESIRELKKYTETFFVEKPVSSGPVDEEEFNDGKIYYVACPLRYTSVIQYVKENVNPNDVLSVRAISSSFLPDWRPGTDYRSTYSANKELGGGVSIDLIHEWDYLTYLFGFPKDVKKILAKKSQLEIDCEDIAVYIAEFEDKLIELHLDYFGKQTRRMLEIITRDEVIVCDLIKNEIKYLISGKTVSFDEKRDDYCKRELLEFFSIIQKKTENENDIKHANRVLKLAR